jgi:thioredoxin reductase
MNHKKLEKKNVKEINERKIKRSTFRNHEIISIKIDAQKYLIGQGPSTTVAKENLQSETDPLQRCIWTWVMRT